jgi:transposase InsO family protein
MRYRFISEHRRRWPVRTMCRVLRVQPGGFYRWQSASDDPPRRRLRRLALIESIRGIHRRSHGAYGSPRVWRQLRGQGERCSRRTVETLMRQQQIRSRRTRRFRLRTTDAGHDHPIAPNRLARRFRRPRLGINRVWMADLSYVPTAEGWLYLAVVMDLASRRVVGLAAADHLRAQLPLAALYQALRSRRPRPGLLHHSDRGVQYACREYRSLLKRHGLKCSMSRAGDCYDNAVVESFFKTLKSELVNHQRYQTRQQASESIRDWVELFYNHQRRHSALGYLSPAAYEDDLC